MNQSDGIISQLATTIKANRLENSAKVPRRVIGQSGAHQNCRRCRTITYPGVRPVPQNLQHSGDYIIEISVQCGSIRAVLVERWRLTLSDSQNTEKTSSNELNLNLFFQALKSTLHFSAITAILKQKSDIKIQTREWSGDFSPLTPFDMASEVATLPVTPVACDSELVVVVESLARSSIPLLLSRLNTLAEVSSGPCLPHKQFYNSISAGSAGGDNEAIKRINFARPRYKSVSEEPMLTDEDANGNLAFHQGSETEFKADEVFSPPSKLIRHERLPKSRSCTSTRAIPTLRNLLTSPPIERQLKYISSSCTSVRLPFAFPTIRRNISRPLLGNFEESILHERLRCVGIVNGFTLDLGALGNFCPPHLKKNIVVRHFATDDDLLAALPSPYLGVLKFGKDGRRGYQIPKCGNLQLTMFNPEGSVVRLFSIPYDFSDMPPNSRTFLRQRTIFKDTRKLRYLIHLRVMSSSKGTRLYLHGDVKVVFSNAYRMQSVSEDECLTMVQSPMPKYSTHCSSKQTQVPNVRPVIPAEVERVRKNLNFRNVSPVSS